MTQQKINISIHNQMKEVANEYFSYIINEFNGTKEEKDWIIPAGKYSASDLAKRKPSKNDSRSYGGWSEKKTMPWGQYLSLPTNDYYDESVTLEADSFRCTFKRRDIFVYMAQWESVMKIPTAARIKFEIKKEDGSEQEVKTVNAWRCDNTQPYQERVKLRSIDGNCWHRVKTQRYKDWDNVEVFYQINGVFFFVNVFAWERITGGAVAEKCKQIPEILVSNAKNSKYCDYWKFICEKCGISTADYSGVLKESATLIDSISSAMSAIESEIQDYALLVATNILDAISEPLITLCNILDMVAKFNAFTDAAEAAGVEIDFNRNVTINGQPQDHQRGSAIIVIDRKDEPREVIVCVADERPTQAKEIEFSDIWRYIDAPTAKDCGRCSVVDIPFGPPGKHQPDRPPP